MGIGKVLDELIKDKNLNVNDLAKRSNVNPQTLYSIIKRDNMKVDLDVLINICNSLDIDLNYFYKSYSIEVKEINTQLKLTQNEQQIIENYRSLNEEEQEKALIYMEDLVDTGKYKKSTQHKLEEKEA